MSERKTLVVNLIGAPGSGKSTYCASIFAELKWRNIECEMALEFAKDVVWEEHHFIFKNQFYVFGQQMNRIIRLQDKVDVIVTDSPILLSVIYDAKENSDLHSMIVKEHHKMNSMNYFINRAKPYHTKGRTQNEAEAGIIGDRIKTMLMNNSVSFEEILGTKENVNIIIDDIVNYLEHGTKRV